MREREREERKYLSTHRVQVVVVAIFLFVIVPLTLVGAVLGRNLTGVADNPCRVNPLPRPIPEKKW